MPYLALYLFVAILIGLAWFSILRRLGWNSWWVVGAFVPAVFFIGVSGVMYFKQWPLERRVAELEAEIARLRGDQSSQDALPGPNSG